MMYGGIQEYTHRIGRTGRIGNVGMATSFYNSRDEESKNICYFYGDSQLTFLVAPVLVKTLLETNQLIPDFLAEFVPEGFENGEGDVNTLNFEEVEAEDDFGGDQPADGGDGWGGAALVAVSLNQPISYGV